MSYRQSLSLLLAGILFVLFFNITTAEAGVIVRPPNNLGLVGYWSLNEGRGTQASDLSGRGNNGVLVNSPGWVSGRFGGGLLLNGSTQHVEIPDSTDFDIGASGFTYAAWIKPASFSQSYNMFMGHYLPYFNVRSNRTLHLSMSAAGSQRHVYGTTLLNADEWYHAVATYDADGYMRVFLDGVQDGVAGPYLTAGNHSSNMYIGKWQSSTSYPFTGEVDEVRVYNRALSVAEIQSLYSNTKSTIVGEVSSNYYSDGLAAHWTFDGGHTTTTTANDRVGSNNGTIYGAVPTIGRIGQALSFDGVNDYVDLPSVNPTSALSVSAWVKSATSSYSGVWQFVSKYNAYIIGDNNNGNKQVCFLVYVGGTWRPSGYGTGTGCYTVDDPENWHHFTGVYDGSSIRFYVDGVLRANNPQTGLINADAGPIHIAHRESAGIGSDHFSGLIDDVRIYNRALSADEVKGLAGGAIGTLNPGSITGSILMERWENIGTSNSVTAIPLGDPPTYTGTLTSFEIPVNWGDAYGVRIRGYLHPESTGNYTFWIASDDNSELWLSTDNNPTNKVRIANVATWTSSRQWSKEANQKSVEIPLVAGKKYYIEVLMKEGAGGDNMAVSWKLNDTVNPTDGVGTFIIPGTVLSPWVE